METVRDNLVGALRHIEVEELRQNSDELIAEVTSTGRPIVITRAGKAVARLVIEQEPPSLFGRGRNEISIVDPNDDLVDILSKEDIDLWYKADPDL